MMEAQRKVISSAWDGWAELYKGEVLELGLGEETVKVMALVIWGGAQGW